MKKSFLTINVLLLTCTSFVGINCKAQTYPFQNPNLSAEQRAENLCSLLTLEEKSRLMEHTSPAIPRLGIPEFNWWSEALHGVGRNGTATVLPITVAMASSFNHELVQKAYDAVSDEARAKNNIARKQNRCKGYEGLSFWTPNINIFRDPRWGRGQETYGEDPYLTTQMGLAVVRGLQGEPGHKYQKLFACAKHFAVHSGPEWNRHSFNVELLPPRDLYETYLPAFKALVQQGDVKEVMCAYQSIDNEPCCGNNRLLQQILRDDWGFKGIVTSDCWALNDFWTKGAHEVSSNMVDGVSKALYAGTDVECGNTYRSLTEAVAAGKVTEEQVDVSLKRLLKGRFELGDFDNDDLVEWRNIGPEVIASEAHHAVANQLAHESIVLLQNRNNILPLSRSAKVAVIGPNASDSVMLWGNYNGFPKHTTTILDGMKGKNTNTTYLKACGLVERKASDSWFDNIRCMDGVYTGLGAFYYNNQDFEGEPVTRRYYQTAMKFDNGGATAFAEGVNLENFSARYEGVLRSNDTETITFSIKYTDKCMLVVDTDTLLNDWNPRMEDRARTRNINFTVQAGKAYNLQLKYAQNVGAASLSFDVGHQVTYSDQQILSAVSDADIVVFVGGISPRLEGEEMRVNYPGFKGGDRTDIELPQVQRDIMAMLHKAGKKIIFVNCSGSAMGLVPETESADAILQAWYGGECGGEAVADVIYGDYNPSGKLPVTFYKNVDQLPDFLDYTMKGRTYRYMTETPLFPFGYGLSYSHFVIDKVSYKKGKVTARVTNDSDRDGDEVVQVYIRRIADTDGPNKSLRGYKRVSVTAGKSVEVSIPLDNDQFEGWDPQTNTMRVVPGKYQITVGNSSQSVAKKLNIQRAE
ncbi:MAG: glycoside hydrolase family 3 C-terminal domain-containing protein [Prevotellaceae bacterium]|nr:glycoside hydrolase family 3 C-terminal domain-containing protein [Candidatus Colivivens equi]